MKKEDILISIITPYYNTLERTKKLANVLIPQLTNDVEWIIVNDGCNDFIDLGEYINKIRDKQNVFFLSTKINSGGASVPRNKGLDFAKGEYIAFIDSDDLISDDYIETILEKKKEDWDFCYISWQGKSNKVIIRDTAPTWNCCVWNSVYKRDLIGDKRFDPKLKMAEDYDFNRKVRNGKKASITKILYYYNEDTPNSLTKQGEMYNSKY